MKPERAQELYSDYAEGTLSPAMRLALEQHFEADPSARAEYQRFAQVFALLDAPDGAMVEVPPGFRANIMERAAAEQARREAAPAHRAALTLTGWFQSVTHRRATGGVLAALAAVALVGVFFHNGSKGPESGGLGGPLSHPAAAIPTTINSVTAASDAGGNHYYFHIHLPANVPQAAVTASMLTDNDQITDADLRARSATPALKDPTTLTNDEEMQIPVSFQEKAPAGTTLNMLVQWKGNTPQQSGSQIVFTPVAPAATPAAPPTEFYDALQAIASQYGVTVIADATNAPTQAVSPDMTAGRAMDALKSVADSVSGYHVQKLPNNAYQVYNTPQ